MDRDDFIRQHLTIDTDSPTGLRWLSHPSKRHAARLMGRPAGTLHDFGYYQTRIQGRLIYNHRIIYFLQRGHWPTGCIDHIDGNPANNNPDNLRDVTVSQNRQNTVARGYCWDKHNRTWLAQIKLDGKQHNLGSFTSEESARSAYLNAKRQLHPTAPERCYV